MDVLGGATYNWHEDAKPSRARYLANPQSVRSDESGEDVSAHMELYDADAVVLGEVGVWESDLPAGLDTVYAVDVHPVEEEIVDVDHGPAVTTAFNDACRARRDGGVGDGDQTLVDDIERDRRLGFPGPADGGVGRDDP